MITGRNYNECERDIINNENTDFRVKYDKCETDESNGNATIGGQIYLQYHDANIALHMLLNNWIRRVIKD